MKAKEVSRGTEVKRSVDGVLESGFVVGSNFEPDIFKTGGTAGYINVDFPSEKICVIVMPDNEFLDQDGVMITRNNLSHREASGIFFNA
jgi:hypothetical protein